MKTTNESALNKPREGTAVSNRGKARVADILTAAKGILISEGLGSLSTRRVAEELGISVGNLAYYFPSKESLLQAMIEHVIDGYDAELRREWETFPNDPIQRFQAFSQYMIEDAKNPEVQGFFYQFWGFSAHNEAAASTRKAMYAHFLQQLKDLLLGIHPQKSAIELENICMTVLTLLEGLHVVYGSVDISYLNSKGFDSHILQQIWKTAEIDR